MPNYILSRTSPPAHIYERKINLGYGIKVDTSDAPTPEPNKGNKMNEQVVELAEKPVAKPAVFADGSVLEGTNRNDGAPEGPKAEEVKDNNVKD